MSVGDNTSRPPIGFEPTDLSLLSTCSDPIITFAVIGDYGSAGQPELDVSTLVKSWNPDFVITVGDNNYPDGSASDIDNNVGQYYHEFIGNYTGGYGLGAASNNFYPTLGNRDWLTKSGNPAVPNPYLNYFTLPNNERYYNFIRGPVEFFALDSDPDEPDGNSSGSIQGNWLHLQLAASNSPWKLVYMHHAPYSSGSSHGSNPFMQWPYQAWGATAVLAGHDHVYERIIRNGFPYFVDGLGGNSLDSFGTPVSGSKVRYNSNYGAMWVSASPECINFQFINRRGTVIDTFTLNKASIGDYIWKDTNGDGVQDIGEDGLSGVTIYLDQNGNQNLDGGEPFDITDINGIYDITGLASGVYTVTVDSSTVPLGYMETLSDPLTINLAEYEDYNGADFGYQPGPASNYIFLPIITKNP